MKFCNFLNSRKPAWLVTAIGFLTALAAFFFLGGRFRRTGTASSSGQVRKQAVYLSLKCEAGKEQKEWRNMEPIKVRNLEIGTGIPKICVPITGTNREDILRTAERVVSSAADLVEWRADWCGDIFDRPCASDILCGLRQILGEIPLLFTFRTVKEGGRRRQTRTATVFCPAGRQSPVLSTCSTWSFQLEGRRFGNS